MPEAHQQLAAATALVHIISGGPVESAAAAFVGIALSTDLAGGVFANQSAVLSDCHVSGAGPAGPAMSA